MYTQLDKLSSLQLVYHVNSLYTVLNPMHLPLFSYSETPLKLSTFYSSPYFEETTVVTIYMSLCIYPQHRLYSLLLKNICGVSVISLHVGVLLSSAS